MLAFTIAEKERPIKIKLWGNCVTQPVYVQTLAPLPFFISFYLNNRTREAAIIPPPLPTPPFYFIFCPFLFFF
jgi:hypothetical protein